LLSNAIAWSRLDLEYVAIQARADRIVSETSSLRIPGSVLSSSTWDHSLASKIVRISRPHPRPLFKELDGISL
jgi:hypothetical protein